MPHASPLTLPEQAPRLTTHKIPCYLFAGCYSGQKRRFASRLNGITQTGNEIKASSAAALFIYLFFLNESPQLLSPGSLHF